MKKFFAEFKEFAMRGNVLDLAVGVIIGGAFQSVVKSLTDDIISPIIGLFAKTDFSNMKLDVLGISIRYGSFVTAVINFIIMAFIIFLLIKIMNKIARLGHLSKEKEVKTKKCPYCLSEIPKLATRCPRCTSILDEKIEEKNNAIEIK